LTSGDDFRFIRTWWEVSNFLILNNNDINKKNIEVHGNVDAYISKTFLGKKWIHFAKGGDFSPYYSNIHLLLDWKNDGEMIKSYPKSYIRNSEFYLKPGLSWTRRTTSDFSLRVLPRLCIFSDKSPSIFTSDYYLWLGLLQSSIVKRLINFNLGAVDAAARSYEVGIINNIPIPPIYVDDNRELEKIVKKCIDLTLSIDKKNEISHYYSIPLVLQNQQYNMKNNLLNQYNNWCRWYYKTIEELNKNQFLINNEISKIYGFRKTKDLPNEDAGGSNSHKQHLKRVISLYGAVCELFSWFFGSIIYRWDIRIALDTSLAPKLPDPFDPLPVCPPGMLVGPNGLPATFGNIVSKEWLRARPDAITLPPEGSVKNPIIPDSEYPIPIVWDGILVDDPRHPDDIIRGVRQVLEVIWKEEAEEIEREVCEILKIKTLRDYFRKTGAKGFWMDHVKRYSKSRRKAPIYWLLQSKRKNYAVWLYYHRLDRDIYFKVLTNYVEPKMREVENRINDLRTKVNISDSGDRKKVEKEIDTEEEFLSELRDFHDKLKRVTDLDLEPDLDDGVVLNIAPLYELIPWREAKKYWEDLMKGKYEWSSISKQLRERRIIK